MLELQKHTGKLKAENYGLMEWALDIQAAINQGYELDMSNEGYCQNFGSLYTCLLMKKQEVQSAFPTGGMLPDNGLMKYVPDDTKSIVSPVEQEIVPVNKQQRKQKGQ